MASRSIWTISPWYQSRCDLAENRARIRDRRRDVTTHGWHSPEIDGSRAGDQEGPSILGLTVQRRQS